jgi:hypothetical protein
MPESPDYDSDAVQAFRQEHFAQYRFAEVASYIESIANWKNAEELKRFHDEAAELARGYSAFLSLARKSSQAHPAQWPNGSPWNKVVGLEGTSIRLQYDSMDAMTEAIPDMDRNEKEMVYSALAKAFGPNRTAKQWIDTVDEAVHDAAPGNS